MNSLALGDAFHYTVPREDARLQVGAERFLLVQSVRFCLHLASHEKLFEAGKRFMMSSAVEAFKGPVHIKSTGSVVTGNNNQRNRNVKLEAKLRDQTRTEL